MTDWEPRLGGCPGWEWKLWHWRSGPLGGILLGLLFGAIILWGSMPLGVALTLGTVLYNTLDVLFLDKYRED